jgi:hypothetical protein
MEPSEKMPAGIWAVLKPPRPGKENKAPVKTSLEKSDSGVNDPGILAALYF